MSKPFSNLFAPAFLLSAALLLLLSPGGLLPPAAHELSRTLLLPLFVLVVANMLCRLGKLARPVVFLTLLLTLLPAFALFETLQHPVYLLLTLLPLALIGLHLAPNLFPDRPQWMFGILVPPLAALTVGPLRQFHAASFESIPVIVYNQDMMVLAALVVPASLALRPILRPAARFIFKAELVLLALPFILAPFVWAGLTSLKEPGETELYPETWKPRPRMVLRKDNFDLLDILPRAWDDEPDPAKLVLAWYETARLLSDPSMRSAFNAQDMPLPPNEMLRALQIYDFVQRDRHGYFVPESTYFLNPPPQMDPSAEKWIQRLRLHAAMTPRRLGVRLDVPRNEALLLLRRLQRIGLARRVLGNADRFRSTAGARRPLENGWHIRQLHLLLTTPEGSWIPRTTYAEAWDLPIDKEDDEIQFLMDQGHLEARKGLWHPDSYHELLHRPELIRNSLIYLAALLTAIGAGWVLHLPKKGMPWWAGGLVLLAIPFPASPLLMIPLRFGAGLYLLRGLLSHKPGIRNGIILYACATAIPATLLSMVPASDPVELRAAWALICFPLPLVLMTLSVWVCKERQASPAKLDAGETLPE